jgi:hypothetical protein
MLCSRPHPPFPDFGEGGNLYIEVGVEERIEPLYTPQAEVEGQRGRLGVFRGRYLMDETRC